MLGDHVQSKIDNENNYNIIFVLSENINKNKHLVDFSKFLLLILHSNSYYESTFSTTRNPKRSALMVAIT